MHAGWLDQVEIIFLALQRKVLTPNDFPSLECLEAAILEFQALHNQVAKPFKWRYTKEDLKKTLEKIKARSETANQLPPAA